MSSRMYFLNSSLFMSPTFHIPLIQDCGAAAAATLTPQHVDILGYNVNNVPK